LIELNKLKQAFRAQAGHCDRLGSPLMVELCSLLAENLDDSNEVGQVLFAWPGDVTSAGASLPLRLIGCLHRLALSGECQKLTGIFTQNHAQLSSTEKWEFISHALTTHQTAILQQLKQTPQTNEIGRSGALLPGFLTIAAQTGGLPFILSEIGASAGLNLNWYRFGYELDGHKWGHADSPIQLVPDWSGSVPELRDIVVSDQAGCDLNPIDLTETQTAQTLLSYTWADQAERLARTRAAIEMAQAHPVTVTKMGAVDWLKERLAQRYEGHVHVIYHTIAWQYFSDADKRRGKELIEKAGAQATADAPLAWLGLETDYKEPGAALTLTVWPGGQQQFLGRADYHGRWVDWSG
jgi:hypothetical protein